MVEGPKKKSFHQECPLQWLLSWCQGFGWGQERHSQSRRDPLMGASMAEGLSALSSPPMPRAASPSQGQAFVKQMLPAGVSLS